MQHFTSWNIKDIFPDKSLDEINLSSDKFFALWARNLQRIKKENDCAVNIIGALDTIEALDYHFLNYVRLKDTESNNQKHELNAYLNRIGQLYYFAKSEFVVKLVPESMEIMKKVDQLKIFRMKNTAHRSIDYPKNESLEMKRGQVIPLLGFTYYFIIDNDKKQFILPEDSDNGSPKLHYFTPEEDHLIVLEETYLLMEKILKEIT